MVARVSAIRASAFASLMEAPGDTSPGQDRLKSDNHLS
jgi:hypothetical protein